ncbi:MAG: hypothetical protein R2932_50330 [Caldilineaceae bacterium]
MSKAYQAIILSILLLCITTAQVAAADCVAGATEIHVNFVNGNDYNSDGTENNGTNANAPVKTTDLLAKIHQGKDVCIISYDAANRELSRGRDSVSANRCSFAGARDLCIASIISATVCSRWAMAPPPECYATSHGGFKVEPVGYIARTVSGNATCCPGSLDEVRRWSFPYRQQRRTDARSKCIFPEAPAVR